MNKHIPLVARILMALLFIMAGINKITNFAGTAGYMEAFGITFATEFVLVLVIAAEILGGLCLVLGWHMKRAASILALFTLLAAAIFHRDFSDSTEMVMFLKNLAIAGGLLYMSVYSAGCCSHEKGYCMTGKKDEQDKNENEERVEE